MKMAKLELFLILFPDECLKEILIPKTNKLLKHPMDPGDFFGGWDVGSTWVAGSEFRTGGTGGQQRSQQCLEVPLSDLIIICQGPGLKEYLDLYVIPIKRMLNIMMGSSTCVKWKNHGTLTWLNSLIHHVLMYLTNA